MIEAQPVTSARGINITTRRRERGRFTARTPCVTLRIKEIFYRPVKLDRTGWHPSRARLVHLEGGALVLPFDGVEDPGLAGVSGLGGVR